MMSLGAAGSLAKTVTNSTWKGRTYLKKHAIPTDPKSGIQIGTRTMFAFLAEQWDWLNAIAKATWEPPATAEDVSPFNAYLGYNLERWSRYLAPAWKYPATEDGTFPTGYGLAPSIAGNYVQLHFTHSPPGSAWGVWIVATLTPPATDDQSQVILAEFINTLPAIDLLWKPPTPGTWYFRPRCFCVQGNSEWATGYRSIAYP
jgi:hypothetical protein